MYGNIRYRSWEHDYFTSCLPFAQKGASVQIPLGEVELKTTFPIQPGIIVNAATDLIRQAMCNQLLVLWRQAVNR